MILSEHLMSSGRTSAFIPDLNGHSHIIVLMGLSLLFRYPGLSKFVQPPNVGDPNDNRHLPQPKCYTKSSHSALSCSFPKV